MVILKIPFNTNFIITPKSFTKFAPNLHQIAIRVFQLTQIISIQIHAILNHESELCCTFSITLLSLSYTQIFITLEPTDGSPRLASNNSISSALNLSMTAVIKEGPLPNKKI